MTWNFRGCARRSRQQQGADDPANHAAFHNAHDARVGTHRQAKQGLPSHPKNSGSKLGTTKSHKTPAFQKTEFFRRKSENGGRIIFG
jgi:hypothetical protein